METLNIAHIATLFFVVAVLHTFSVSIFNRLAARFKKDSFQEKIFHLLGEIEVVFGFWSLFFILSFLAIKGRTETISYLSSRSYSEPIFVFVIMIVCSSKPIKDFVNSLISIAIKPKFLNPQASFFFLALAVTPLLGSLITEPAAMTIAATLILNVLFEKNQISDNLKYSILALLFVNISIGGTLTSYAAPPVLMVADAWGWDTYFMITQFGFKAILACFASTFFYFLIFKKSILELKIAFPLEKRSPLLIQLITIIFIFFIVLYHKSPSVFISLFLFFIGFVRLSKSYQDDLKVKESFLVGFFLAGLIILGGLQNWWLEPIVSGARSEILFFSSMGLTAVTDNAAITYLGTLVSDISDKSKYALVAGAVIGGGLTVIANAPNPAGYGILNSQFGKTGIRPGPLFLFAILPTVVSAIIFYFL